MFLHDLIQRKLASLLQPWLLQELELELKLGFLRSHGIAKNLIFDTSAFNQLLDDPTSLSFTDFRVDQLSLRMSNWSAPAFTIEVHGVHVTLAVGLVEEGRGVRRSRKPTDSSLEDRKKVLSEIDPEGSALHDVMGSISEIACSRNQTSLLNVLLTHCRLQMRDINLLVQSSISNDAFSCLLEIKELNAESQHIEPGCFLRGFISSLFVPSRESYFGLEIRDFKIGLKSKDRVSPLSSLKDFLCSMKLKDFQLTNFHCCIPESVFVFSPADVSIILMFYTQSSKKSTHVKNGRQLWKEAARKIRSFISTRRWSMRKVVSVVCILCYIHAYENLLLLVGYPVDKKIKRSAIMMSGDQIFSRSFRHQWKVVSEIEKEIPAAAIALARRVVRYKVATNVIQGKNELLVNIYFEFLRKILQVIALIWTTIVSMFNSMIHLRFLKKKVGAHPKMNVSGVLSEDSCTDRCFSVNMGKVSFTIYPENVVQPSVGGKTVPNIGISYSDLLLFGLSIDTFFLKFNENVSEHCLSFSCGSLKVFSSSAMGANSNNYGSSEIGRRKKKVHDSETILWGRPVSIFNHAEAAATGVDDIKGASIPLLESLLRQMWLDWKNSCTESEQSKIHYLENPSILCEIKGFLTDQCHDKSTSYRFWKCCLAVGELDFFLGYSSIISLALLLRQIQDALCWTDSNQKGNVFVRSPTTSEGPAVSVWDCNSCIGGIEMALHKLYPERFIQVGVFIVGPHIRVSLRKEGFHGRNAKVNRGVDDLHFVFDFHNVELAISPTLASDPASSNDAAPEFWLKEPEAVDIPKSDDEIYQCQGKIPLGASLKINGLNAYLDDTAELQQFQVIVLNPITMQLSSARTEVCSLGESVVAFSAALHGIASGLTVLIFIDELSVLVEVVVGLMSAMSCAVTTIDSIDSVNSQDLIRQEMSHASSKSKQTLASTVNGGSLILNSTLSVLNFTSEIQSVDIILHKSRKSNKMENQVIISDSLNSPNSTMQYLPDYGIRISVQQLYMKFAYKSKGGKVEGLTDFSGLRIVIFRYASDIMKSSDQFELSNLLLQSLDCLYEASVSNCTFSFWLSSLQNELSSLSSAIDTSTSGGYTSHMVENSHLTNYPEEPRAQPSDGGRKTNFAQKIIAPASSCWLLVRFDSSEIYVVGCPVKDILVKAHQLHKLESSLTVGENVRQ